MVQSTPPEHFDAIFAGNPDPWGHQTAEHEVRKYAQTLTTLPDRPYRRGLEIGCGVGVMTVQLADRCGSLLAIDQSAEALVHARARTRHQGNVRIEQMRVPAEYPPQAFDLTVLSEVGYYLSRPDLDRLLSMVAGHLEPGGVFLLVHFLPRLPELALTGDDVHQAALDRAGALGLRHLSARREAKYRIDVLERDPSGTPPRRARRRIERPAGAAEIAGAAARPVTGPHLLGGINQPAPGVVVPPGLVHAWGWALDPASGRAEVVLRVGRPWEVSGGQPRSDVARVLPDLPGAHRSGWTAQIDLTGFPPGDAELRLEAIGEAGQTELVQAHTIRIGSRPGGSMVAGRIRGVIDHPAEAGCLPCGVTSVWGWLVDEAGPVRGVMVTLDGAVAAIARHDPDRADLAEALDDGLPEGIAGWAALVDLSGQDVGNRLTLGLIALRANGTAPCLAEATFEVADQPLVASAQGGIDPPDDAGGVRRGLVAVSGWAAPPFSVATVEVTVDGRPAGRARLGLPRPWIHARHPAGVLGGWEHTVDLSDLPGEPPRSTVVIGAVVHGLGGEVVELPAITAVLAAELEPSAPGHPAIDLVAPAAATKRRLHPGSAPPRVLVVAHSLGIGGAELWLHDLLERLIEVKAVTATVIAPFDGVGRESLERMGIEVHLSGDVPVESDLGYRHRLDELVAWTGDRGADVVLANTLLSHAGVHLAHRLGRPVIWAIHEGLNLATYLAGYRREFLPLRTRVLAALGSAAAITFPTEANRALLVEHGDPRRFCVVPYGIDTAAIDAYAATHPRPEQRQRLGLPDQATVVVWVGTICPRKSQALLAQAVAHLADEHPDLHLVLIGDVGDAYSAAIHAYVDAADLSERIRVVPPTGDRYEWTRAADLFVCPSDQEGLPLSVLEAMALGLPVLSTGVAGLGELVVDGVTGWRVEERSLGSLIDGLRRVLSLPIASRAEVAARARQLVRERYAVAAHSRGYARLIRGLAGDPDALPDRLLAD